MMGVGGSGWLEVTTWMFKSISEKMLTPSTPTKPDLAHFQKQHPIYLGAQDQDLEVKLFPPFPYLPHLIHQ